MSQRLHRDVRGGFAGGAVIVLIGLAFLLDNMGIISVSHLYRFWPMLLVVAGLLSISSPQGRVKGAILIVLGGMLELNSLGIAHFGWNMLWPVMIIAAGLMVMWSTLEAHRVAATGDPRDSLNEFVLFGGVERRVTSTNFKGGSITAIFGGIEIDLRQAEMTEAQAELDVNAMCGGCEIRVPETWEIVARGQGIFGGYVDSTKGSKYNYPADAPGATPRKILILRGMALFGGVEIKN